MDKQSTTAAGQEKPQHTRQSYFTVGAVKLSLMSITTGGIYELYWFYRNWLIIRDCGHDAISPFWRAFFAPLWTFSMGSRLKQEGFERNVPLTLPAPALGVIYLLLNMAWRLPGAFWFVSLLTFVPILPFEFAARRLNGGGLLSVPTFGRFSGWNIAWLAIGSILLGLVVVGQLASIPSGLLAETAWIVNRETPRMIDSVTRFDGVEAGPGLTFQYNYSILNASASEIDHGILNARFQGEVRRELLGVVCTSEDTKVFRKLGVVVRYHYMDKNGVPLGTVEIPARECTKDPAPGRN